MLTEAEILKFIQEDISSKKKQLAKVGQDYYEGKHDILNYKLYYFNADGQLVEDTTRSNIKIPHPFFTELVDQCVQYMLSGKEGYMKSDIPELQELLDEYFNDNEDFTSELSETIRGSKAKGFEYMYAYKNEEGQTAFQCADSMGVVEVDKKYTDDNIDYVIYWYIDRIKDGKTIKKVQVWDSTQVHYYVMVEDGKLEKDESYKINPKPHSTYKMSNDPNKTYYENFGQIPFFRLDNNKKQISDLVTVKALIDDYDLMACGLSNNLQDASEYLVVVSGFQGDNLEELMQNVKTKKMIGVDEGGNLDYKAVDVPYEARKVKLELDEKNIYRFGMGFNSAQLGDGNITNIVIKSRYVLLDLKCDKLEIRLKQFLKKILKMILKEINELNKTDYQLKDVKIKFKREVMTNALDNAQIEQVQAQTKQIIINTLLGLAATLDDETIIQKICEVLDIDYEEIKGKLPKDETNIEGVEDTLNEVIVDEQV